MNIIRILTVLLVVLVAAGIIVVLKMAQTPVRLRKAEEHLKNNDLQKANEIIKKVLRKQKDHVKARYLRAKILMQQTQYLLAIAELNSVLGLPDFKSQLNELDIHNDLAFMYRETQQWQKEVEEYRIILGFNPDDVAANHRIGHVLYKQKNYAEARGHLERAFAGDPSLFDCLVPLGVSSYYQGDFAGAEQYLLKAIEAKQTGAEIQFHLGLIYKWKKDHEAAVKMFNSSKLDKSYFVQSLYNLGEVYAADEKYEEAIQTLEQGLGSIQGKGEEALSYRYLLAECYEMAHKINEAVYHWDKIVELNQGYRDAKSKLEEYRQILGNENQKVLFTASLEELQPLISELIARLNYSIISRREVNVNEYIYKVFNIKRINEPPVLIYFNRTTREIGEGQIIDFSHKMNGESCKSGIYITTSRFSPKAKNTAGTMMIDLLDSGNLGKLVERIMVKKAKT